MRRTRVWVLRVFGMILLLLIIGWAVEYMQQWIFGWRAERLLADVKALEIKPNSWGEAQRFMHTWGRWGGYEGTCNEQECYYSVWIRHIVPFGAEFDKKGKPNPHLARLTDYLGLRSSLVVGRFELYRGAMITKSFGTAIHLPARNWITPEGALMSDLMVSSVSGTTLRHGTDTQYFALHPNRRYLYFKEPDDTLAVKFTPQETPAEQVALMDLHLSCLTKWVACQSRGDILPGAFDEFEEERHAFMRKGSAQQLPVKCPALAMSRDAVDVFVGEVVRPDPVLKRRGSWSVAFRVEEILKGHAPVPVGTEMTLALPLSAKESMQKELPLRIIFAGDTQEWFDTSDDRQGKIFLPEDCEVIEANEANLQAARQGAAEDVGDRPY